MAPTAGDYRSGVIWKTRTSSKAARSKPDTIFFTGGSGQLTAGVWECTPCTTQTGSYPVDEFCYILNGAVVITDDAGQRETFKAGDCFIVPKGTSLTWHMPETTRKYYVIFDAKTAET